MHMKKIVLFCCLLIAASTLVAQPNYKVVFDLTSKDSVDQQAVIRWINEVIKAEPTAQVEVVMFAKGTTLAVRGKSAVAADVEALSKNKNVAFKVCEVAMKNQGIDKSQLIPGVQTVPDGIYEIISKQREGWGYIKAKN